MIENNPPKGVSFSDLICIFAMSIVGFSCFFCNTKISENSDMAKILSNFLLLRYLKSLIYNSVAELRIDKNLQIPIFSYLCSDIFRLNERDNLWH